MPQRRAAWTSRGTICAYWCRKHHRQPKLVRYLGLACKDQGPTGSGMINVTECRELAAECRQRLIARKPSGCDPFLSTPRERGTDWRSKSSTARQESPPRKCCDVPMKSPRANKSWTLSILVTPRSKCMVRSRVGLIGPNAPAFLSGAFSYRGIVLAWPLAAGAPQQAMPLIGASYRVMQASPPSPHGRWPHRGEGRRPGRRALSAYGLRAL